MAYDAFEVSKGNSDQAARSRAHLRYDEMGCRGRCRYYHHLDPADVKFRPRFVNRSGAARLKWSEMIGPGKPL